MTTAYNEFQMLNDLILDVQTRAMQDTKTYQLLTERALELAADMLRTAARTVSEDP